jgi:hypothetical protein
MSLNDEFMSNPGAFTEKYVIVVADTSQLGPNNVAGPKNFTFVSDYEQYVSLRVTKDGIKAYWLPWKDKGSSTMDLGSDADYFFTTQMTGCRFSVLTGDPKRPKVSHVAGTLEKSKRNAEDAKTFGTDVKNVRRLSITGQKAEGHHYGGQTGDGKGSSAFVYGLRSKEGNWAFEAQIVDIVIVQGFDPIRNPPANTPKIESHKIAPKKTAQ